MVTATGASGQRDGTGRCPHLPPHPAAAQPPTAPGTTAGSDPAQEEPTSGSSGSRLPAAGHPTYQEGAAGDGALPARPSTARAGHPGLSQDRLRRLSQPASRRLPRQAAKDGLLPATGTWWCCRSSLGTAPHQRQASRRKMRPPARSLQRPDRMRRRKTAPEQTRLWTGRLQARHEASQAQPGAFGGPADAPQPGSSGRGCAVPAGEEFWGTPRIGAAGFAKTPAGTRRAKPSPTTARGEAPDASLPTRPARRHRFRRGDALAISATPPSLGRELKSGRSAPPLRSRERPRGGGCQRKRPRRVSSGSRARARGGTLRARASNAACCRQRGHGRRGIGRLRSPSYQAGQRYKGGRQPGFTPRGQDPLLRPGRTRRGGRRHKSWDFAVGILLRGGRAGLSQRWISPVLPRPSPNCPYPRSGCRGRTGNWESGAQAPWTGKRLRRAALAWPSSRPARHERSWSAKKRPKNPSFALNSSEGEGG